MLFELKDIRNEKLEKDFQKMMKELNDFYGIDWVRNLPHIFFVESRKQIDKIWGNKTERWLIGWTNSRDIFVLKNEKMGKESNHKKHSGEEFYSLVKHELSHSFYNILSENNRKPIWLIEGVAIYTSGQNQFKKYPKKFSDFLEFYDKGGKEVYSEAGFAVEILVKKFDKEKLLSFIKNLKNYQSKELFENAFEKEYGFQLNYENLDHLLE